MCVFTYTCALSIRRVRFFWLQRTNSLSLGAVSPSPTTHVAMRKEKRLPFSYLVNLQLTGSVWFGKWQSYFSCTKRYLIRRSRKSLRTRKITKCITCTVTTWKTKGQVWFHFGGYVVSKSGWAHWPAKGCFFVVKFSSRHFALGQFYTWIHIAFMSRNVLFKEVTILLFFFFFLFCLQHLGWMGSVNAVIHVWQKEEFFAWPIHDSFRSQEGLLPRSVLLHSS